MPQQIQYLLCSRDVKAVSAKVREDSFFSMAGAGLQTQHLDQSQMAWNPLHTFRCCIAAVPNQYFVITCNHHPTPVPSIKALCIAQGYS